MKKMNCYRLSFVANSPDDVDDPIVYQLEIKTDETIRVEHIKTATSLIKKGYHENIADELFERFGGVQRIVASHQGVEIETLRSEE
jgi:hypothetical protein